MEKETNSEKTVLKILGVVALIVIGVGGAVASLGDAGLAEQWPWFATVVTIFGFVSKLAWEYIRSRPEKHKALALRTHVNGPGVDDLAALMVSKIRDGKSAPDAPPKP